MTNPISIPQAASAAQSVGFTGEALITLCALAIPESGFQKMGVWYYDADAHNPVMPDDSRGWLQINVQPKANPQYASWNLYDPAICAKAAWEISAHGTNWIPWANYANGVYLQYVPMIRAALGGSPMPVTKPAWTFVGTGGVNIWVGRRLQPIAIVAHIMEGTLAGCDSWFSNPAAQASANFGVGKNGTIHCYVDPDGKDAPYANGNLAGPDAAVQALVTQMHGTNPNYWSLSIEHEGHSGEALTTAQLDASGHLAAWLCQHFGIPADENHLLGHYEFDSVTRAGCPGWDRNGWLAWEGAISHYLGGVPAPVPTPPGPGPQPDIASARSRIQSAMVDLQAAVQDLNS